MHYNIKGTDLSVTPELRAYVEKKLASLDRLVADPGAARADVELHFMVGEARMYRAEIMYQEPALARTLRAEARGATMHEAIDLAEASLFDEMSRAKEKRVSLMRRGAVKAKDFLRGLRDRF